MLIPITTFVADFRLGIHVLPQCLALRYYRRRIGLIGHLYIHRFGLAFFIHSLQEKFRAVAEVVYRYHKFAFFIQVGIIHHIGLCVICHQHSFAKRLPRWRFYFARKVHHRLGHVAIDARIACHSFAYFEALECCCSKPCFQFAIALSFVQSVISLGKWQRRTKVGEIEQLTLGVIHPACLFGHQPGYHCGPFAHLGQLHRLAYACHLGQFQGQ